MRKLYCVFLSIIMFLLCSCNTTSNKKIDKTKNICKNINNIKNEMKAVWINYYELSMKGVSGGDETSFAKKIDDIFKTSKDFGLNTVIVQVRPYSDAFYKSNVFPFSKYITGEQGRDPGYDPLKIMCDIAKKYELKLHAWINPYRVSYDKNYEKLSNDNPAKIWKTDDNTENDSWIIETDLGIFYNPSVPQVQKLIIDGVREIVKNYDVNGIHLDDYFYPSTDLDIDKVQYEIYKKNGGKSSVHNWRRDNVNTLISNLYSTIKILDSSVKLGISPSGDIKKNFDTHYADVNEWISFSGYLDYIIPQLYYGFKNESKPFKDVAEEWSKLVKDSNVQICYGLALYKCGIIDDFAGKGKNEWIKNNDILSKQIVFVRNLENYNGIVLYSYNFLKSENKDIKLLKNVI